MHHYLKFYSTVELNNSFYRLPSYETFCNWRKSVPDYFIFAVKANRFITHMKKLKEPVEHFNNLIEKVDGLEEKLGPILFQLPPGWNYDRNRFKEFLNVLPASYRYTFEFRNHTWYNQEVYDLLNKRNMAFCIYELEFHTTPLAVTADFVYIRLHGPWYKYQGSYSDEALDGWTNNCINWRNQGKDVYVYFDNDQDAFAAYNAQTMNRMIWEKDHPYG
ncbi:MAG: DUF72 domain-containing protein [Bacteroidota bacterium]|nr:DUF72 domain-containing protein [Bacteroidota bacterium]